MRSWKTLLAAAALSYASHALALGGLADLSVYDRTEGRQLAVHWHERRAYVAGEPGNEYQVTLRSRSRVALEIRGWRKSLAQTAAFHFTSLPDPRG